MRPDLLPKFANSRRLALAGPVLATALAAPAAWAQSVEKCAKEMGSLAVAEPQAHYMQGLTRYGLGSPAIMLRMMAQESGCFAVVERGVAMQNLQQERALAAGGQLQQGSNIGAGQMQAADFVMTPVVQFSGDTGGVGGAVSNLLGRAGGVLGAIGGIAGGVKFKEAETTLLVADVRSGIQVASAEGKATKMNFSLGGWGWGGLGWATGGGYTKTPEGKLIAASLLDNFNKIVQQIRDKPQLIRSTAQSSQANAAASIQATGATAPVAPVMSVAPAAVVTTTTVVTPGRAARNAPPPQSGDERINVGALQGQYSGKFTGPDAGTFTVRIGPNGQVGGVAKSDSGTNFIIMGQATAEGHLMLTMMSGASALNQKPAGSFTGMLGNDGTVAGNWRTDSSPGLGQFQGQKTTAADAASAPTK
jgi:Curli production assembly/transport component CsgG